MLLTGIRELGLPKVLSETACRGDDRQTFHYPHPGSRAPPPGPELPGPANKGMDHLRWRTRRPAGSICWFEGGTTDSFGPELQAVTNGLGFLPYANGVHYDSEDRRRPLVHRLVADGTLGTTHCTDDGVGMPLSLVVCVTCWRGGPSPMLPIRGDRFPPDARSSSCALPTAGGSSWSSRTRSTV
jgi:hypothetical protein